MVWSKLVVTQRDSSFKALQSLINLVRAVQYYQKFYIAYISLMQKSIKKSSSIYGSNPHTKASNNIFFFLWYSAWAYQQDAMQRKPFSKRLERARCRKYLRSFTTRRHDLDGSTDANVWNDGYLYRPTWKKLFKSLQPASPRSNVKGNEISSVPNTH